MSQQPQGRWSNGLLSCFGDCGLCLITNCVPCYTFGKVAEAIGEGPCFQCGLTQLVPLFNLYKRVQVRGKIRQMKGIEGSGVGDCFTILFCHLCTLVQEAREVTGKVPAAQSMARE